MLLFFFLCDSYPNQPKIDKIANKHAQVLYGVSVRRRKFEKTRVGLSKIRTKTAEHPPTPPEKKKNVPRWLNYITLFQLPTTAGLEQENTSFPLCLALQ
jgi:hypothetical protein